MKEIKFTYENQTCTMFINQIEAGHIELGGEEIMYSEIEEEFRGKGYYSMLLIAAFNMSESYVLYSYNRNEFSNPCYEKWVNTDLEETETLVICVDDEKLNISIQSEC